jgi:BirA family biotin operon repressor/biotin-[acetyl-CoA-carboxylase] ligase
LVSESGERGRRLLEHLADGRTHSGTDLAAALGVTRAAVWKQLARLRDCGLAVDAVRGRGYQLRRPIDLLDRSEILCAVDAATRERLARLDVFAELDSTNAFLLAQAPPARQHLDACLAEYQQAGRGRRGRPWVAPLGGGLCLSVGWLFEAPPPAFSCLSLALGVVVRRVLAALAGIEIGLKWPNDLVFERRKLGGILVEVAAEAQGACHVVAGIGLNLAMRAETLAEICDWPEGAVDLDSIAVVQPGRCRLAAGLISACGQMFADFEDQGFAAFADEWHAADSLSGKQVLVSGALEAAGRVVGIADDGALLLATESGRTRIVAGDVRLRPL